MPCGRHPALTVAGVMGQVRAQRPGRALAAVLIDDPVIDDPLADDLLIGGPSG